MTWIMSMLALGGTIMNAEKNRWGFLLWIVTNAYWAVVDFQAGLWAQGCLFVAYLVLAIRGLWVWSRGEKK